MDWDSDSRYIQPRKEAHGGHGFSDAYPLIFPCAPWSFFCGGFFAITLYGCLLTGELISMCFWGNVSSSMLCTGAPDQVKTDVKELIDLFKDTGGLIIDATNGMPDEARPENVQAMTDAAMEYGIY